MKTGCWNANIAPYRAWRTIRALAALLRSSVSCWTRSGCSRAASRCPDVTQQVSTNNANSGGGFYSQGGQFVYIRGLGEVKTIEDIGNVVVKADNGIPTRM